MKIRIKGNSVRLRLSQKELKEFKENGRVVERTFFGPEMPLVYALMRDDTINEMHANFKNNNLCVFVPKADCEKWFEEGEVSIKKEMEIDEYSTLSILVEKDFQCLDDREGEDESDLFPNPKRNG